jgi:ketosteroid isomerase-like protein
MSRENVELHRRAIAAVNTRDIEAFVALCAPEAEFQSVFAAVGGAIYRKPEGMRRWFRDVEDTWADGLRIEPHAYFDLGERTLLSHVLHGRGRRSSIDTAMPVAHVFTWREGLFVHWKSYLHKEDALRELGVSEHELEPIEP